jgi:hypothetical protein
VIAGLGKLAAHYNDAQTMLLIGKTALARDLPMDVYAFPDVGVPNCSPIGPQVDRCIIYAIVLGRLSYCLRRICLSLHCGGPALARQ